MYQHPEMTRDLLNEIALISDDLLIITPTMEMKLSHLIQDYRPELYQVVNEVHPHGWYLLGKYDLRRRRQVLNEEESQLDIEYDELTGNYSTQ